MKAATPKLNKKVARKAQRDRNRNQQKRGNRKAIKSVRNNSY